MSSIKSDLNDGNLLKLRKRIDKIDDQIIDLLAQRMDVVDEVAALKKSRNEKLFIKSNREADMIKNIVNKLDSRYPKSHIVAIWRKIIASANLHEQYVNIGLLNPDDVVDYQYLIYEYYSRDFPIKKFNNPRDLVAQIENHEVKIAIFPVSKENQDNLWWRFLIGSSIKIFAKIPFIKDEENDNELFCAGLKIAHPSQSDITLLNITLVDQELTFEEIDYILQNANLNLVKILDYNFSQENKHYFCEISGYYNLQSEEIDELQKNPELSCDILGYYATQISF